VTATALRALKAVAGTALDFVPDPE